MHTHYPLDLTLSNVRFCEARNIELMALKSASNVHILEIHFESILILNAHIRKTYILEINTNMW